MEDLIKIPFCPIYQMKRKTITKRYDYMAGWAMVPFLRIHNWELALFLAAIVLKNYHKFVSVLYGKNSAKNMMGVGWKFDV